MFSFGGVWSFTQPSWPEWPKDDNTKIETCSDSKSKGVPKRGIPKVQTYLHCVSLVGFKRETKWREKCEWIKSYSIRHRSRRLIISAFILLDTYGIRIVFLKISNGPLIQNGCPTDPNTTEIITPRFGQTMFWLSSVISMRKLKRWKFRNRLAN